jgi:putative ATPase
MLRAGEDPKFIARRMVVFASEDVGLAAPATLNLAISTFLAVERIGLPEAQFALFECAIVLTKTNKSRDVANAMVNALNAADNYPDILVPLHLRNAPTKLMKELGYQENYLWKAGFQHQKGFLPNELKDLKLFKSQND